MEGVWEVLADVLCPMEKRHSDKGLGQKSTPMILSAPLTTHSSLQCYPGGVVVTSVSSRSWYWECFSHPRGVLGAGDNVWLSVDVPHSPHWGAADADRCAQRLKCTIITLTLGTPGLFPLHPLSSVRPPPCTWFHPFYWGTLPAHSRAEAKQRPFLQLTVQQWHWTMKRIDVCQAPGISGVFI